MIQWALLLTVLVSHTLWADTAHHFQPAHFVDGAQAFGSHIKVPGSRDTVDLEIKCASVVSAKGKMTRAICFGPDRHSRSFKRAVQRVLGKPKLVPAAVDGVAQEVVMQFTVHFLRSGEEESVTVFPNHGHNSDRYGRDYTAVQRYQVGLNTSPACKHHRHRYRLKATTEVTATGQVSSFAVAKGDMNLGACEEDILAYLENGSYIPATHDGRPVPASYQEIYMNFVDQDATY